MSYKLNDFSGNKRLLIYSDCVSDADFEINEKTLLKYGKGSPVAFYAKSLWINRKKLTPKRILFNIKGALGKNK